jgi:BirA family biotin operon repressor/biotin-[acetyl-CoA-carboxylase] ligase
VYRDLERPPLPAAALATSLARDGFDVRVVAETGSTNADAAAAARAGAAEGTVIVAERQTAGRGRLDRRWESPPGSGLTFTVLLRPPVPASRLGWVPLLTGVALVTALRTAASLDCGLKWPNDVLAGGGKLAGILVEAVPTGGRRPALAVGIGLNVTTRPDELPPGATSVAAEGGAETARPILLAAVLRTLARAYAGWLADPSALPPAYRHVCRTLGRQVRVELPGGEHVSGTATEVDERGRLVVAGRAFEAGDVTHLR